MTIISEDSIKDIKERLKAFISYEEGYELRKKLLIYAIQNYKRQNTLDDYISFLNRHECSFSLNHAQSTNFPFYFKMFSVVSQHVHGDCVEECLDQAIVYENGKPRPWFWTPKGDGTFTVTSIVHIKDK